MHKLRFSLPSRQQANRTVNAYSKNFSLALLNWEINRQETRFAFSIFEPQRTPAKKSTLD